MALAAFACWYFSCIIVIWNPGHYGEHGLNVDSASWLVDTLLPGSPADKAGVRLGDRIERAPQFRDRLTLMGALAPFPRERITFRVHQGAKTRTIELQARPQPALSSGERIALALQVGALAVFLIIGIALVLLRPSRMTWGFYLSSFAFTVGFTPKTPFPTDWYLSLFTMSIVLSAAGLVGYLVFCVRFPTNAASGWRTRLDDFAPFLAALVAAYFIYEEYAKLLFITPIDVAIRLWNGWIVIILATMLLATVALVTTYVEARGLERHRIRWVILGLICTFIGGASNVLSWVIPFGPMPLWFQNSVGVLDVALPVTVAYAVVRHRVIDVRFVVTRSLTIGIIGALLVCIAVAIDWLFSTKLPSSRFEAAAYAGVALLVGFSLNVGQQRLGKTIDYLFFRQWFRSQEQSGILADAIRRAASKEDFYGPLTLGVASVFSLASAALFERMEGGGFVRVIANGWPSGSIWHLLPRDSLTKVAETPRVRDVESHHWPENAVPHGVARPTIMFPIVARGRSAAIVLYGAHQNGTALDPDEIRTIRGLAADAGMVYGASPLVVADSTANRSALFGD